MFLSAGKDNTCLASSKSLQCFGANDYGKSQGITDLKNIHALSTGETSTCIIDDEGVKCQGQDYNGQASVPFTLQGSITTS